MNDFDRVLEVVKEIYCRKEKKMQYILFTV